MRQFLAILTVLVAVVAAQAAAPAYSAVDATYLYEYVSSYNPATIADDTISNAAADSVTIISNMTIEDGWEYILQKAATTGGNGTSNEISLRLYALCYDGDGTLIQTVDIDTVIGTTTAAGESILLPFGGTVFANKVTLKYSTTVTDGNDAAILIGNHYLIRRRPIHYQRRF